MEHPGQTENDEYRRTRQQQKEHSLQETALFVEPDRACHGTAGFREQRLEVEFLIETEKHQQKRHSEPEARFIREGRAAGRKSSQGAGEVGGDNEPGETRRVMENLSRCQRLPRQ